LRQFLHLAERLIFPLCAKGEMNLSAHNGKINLSCQMQEINNSTIESSSDGKRMSDDFKNLKSLADSLNETMQKFKV
jgi:hypothetical protein